MTVRTATGFVASLKTDDFIALCELVRTLCGVDLAHVTAWGFTGLPPIGITRVGGLRAVDPGLGTDVVIRGNDGTAPPCAERPAHCDPD